MAVAEGSRASSAPSRGLKTRPRAPLHTTAMGFRTLGSQRLGEATNDLRTVSDSMQQDKRIYSFGGGQAEGGNDLKHLVGGKGASLAEMTRAGLNVPPGFTISAACCDAYFRSGGQWPPGLEGNVRAALARLERLTGRTFGRGDNPLLL